MTDKFLDDGVLDSPSLAGHRADGVANAAMPQVAEAPSSSRGLRVLDFALLLRQLATAVIVRDAQSGQITELNDAAARLFGLSRHQMLGRTWHQIYGKRFADWFCRMDQVALSTPEGFRRLGAPVLRADGDVRKVDYVVFSAAGPNVGEGSSLVSLLDDRTDLIRAQEALQDAEARFREIAAGIDQFVFVAQSDLQRILFANDRLESLIGVDARAVCDDVQRVKAALAEGDLAEFDLRWPRRWAALRRMRKVEFTVRVRHPRRGVRWVHVRMHPARIPAGDLRIYGVADDVTERWAAERLHAEEALAERDRLLRELHDRISRHLGGVAAMLRQLGQSRPDLTPLLEDVAGQVATIGRVHGVQQAGAEAAAALDLVQGVCTQVSESAKVPILFESDDPALWNWSVPDQESLALSLVVNELCNLAVAHRAEASADVDVRATGEGRSLVIDFRYAGALPPETADATMRGFALVRTLLPRRGTQLKTDSDGSMARFRLRLSEPALIDLRDDLLRHPG